MTRVRTTHCARSALGPNIHRDGCCDGKLETAQTLTCRSLSTITCVALVCLLASVAISYLCVRSFKRERRATVNAGLAPEVAERKLQECGLSSIAKRIAATRLPHCCPTSPLTNCCHTSRPHNRCHTIAAEDWCRCRSLPSQLIAKCRYQAALEATDDPELQQDLKEAIALTTTMLTANKHLTNSSKPADSTTVRVRKSSFWGARLSRKPPPQAGSNVSRGSASGGEGALAPGDAPLSLGLLGLSPEPYDGESADPGR